MKTSVYLTLIGVATLAFAASSFQGAQSILDRVAKIVPGSGQTKQNPANQLFADVKAYRNNAAKLTPEDAANQWIALLKRLTSLSTTEMYEAMDRGRRLDLAMLIQALPPPEAWKLVAAQLEALESDSTPRELAFRMVAAVLRNDSAGIDAINKQLRQHVNGMKGLDKYTKQQHLNICDSLDDEVNRLAGRPSQMGERFIKLVEMFEKGDPDTIAATSSYLNVPELVALLGKEEAKKLLNRVLGLKLESLAFSDDETRDLAAEVALEKIDSLRGPQWELVTSVDSAPLFEAMEKKFGSMPSVGAYQNAESQYLTWLIATNQSKEAVRRVEDSLKRPEAQRLDLAVYNLDGIGREGLSIQVMNFLRELLKSDGSRPYWDEYINLAGQYGRSEEALQLLEQTLADPQLTADTQRELKPKLAKALLAADQRERGLQALREALMLGRSKQDIDDGVMSFFYVVDQYASLGRLLGKPEVLEDVAKMVQSAISQSSSNLSRSTEEVKMAASTLSSCGFAAEAEKAISDQMIKVKSAPDGDRFGSSQLMDGLLIALATLYDKAGRYDDVITLLESSPDWKESDLSRYTQAGGEGDALLTLAARALIKTGRKQDAAPVVRRAIQSNLGSDANYALLLDTHTSEEARAFLAKVQALQRFQERPLIWKSQTLLNDRQIEAAEVAIKEAIAIDPSDGEQGKGDRMRAYSVLGAILEQKGDGAGAAMMANIVKAIRASEDADDWWQAGLLKEAVQRYEAALTSFSDAYCVQSRLALRSAELGDNVSAERHYLKAFELMPDSFGRVESHCFGCEGAFRTKLAQELAERVFSRLAKEKPNNPQVHYLMGYLRKSQDRPKEAAAAFRRAVELDPDYMNAWNQLNNVSDGAEMSLQERDEVALNRLRLDLGGSLASAIVSSPASLPKLWKLIYEAESTAPVLETGPVFALKSVTGNDQSNHRGEDDMLTADPRVAITQHPILQSVAYWADAIGGR